MSTPQLDKSYDPKAVEARWYQVWTQQGYFHASPTHSGQPYSIVITYGQDPTRNHNAWVPRLQTESGPKITETTDLWGTTTQTTTASTFTRLPTGAFALATQVSQTQTTAVDGTVTTSRTELRYGYDATGRATRTNELEPIATELARFITAIEEGQE